MTADVIRPTNVWCRPALADCAILGTADHRAGEAGRVKDAQHRLRRQRALARRP